MERIVIICTGFVLDLLLGDPHFIWHPVRGIGAVIAGWERILRKVLRIAPEKENDRMKKRMAGVLLAGGVLSVTIAVAVCVLDLAGRIHPELRICIECVICYQMLAMKSLRVESMKVYHALMEDDVEKARYALSMIVGRDTESLDREGIEKAAIETVAENTSDGVIAPLFYMFLFGALGGIVYKAVNTLDSMVGYKNDTYIDMGWASAKLDDILNFIPSRIAAFFMVAASFLLGYNGKNAIFIYRRDRLKHASPNSAQTEAVCAGALSIELAGDACYFGKRYHKPVIGDAHRKVEAEDIRRANRLLYMTSLLVFCTGMVILSILQVCSFVLSL